MKRYRYIALISVIVVFILSITTIVYANEAFINVNNLNVRSGPGTDFEKVAQIDQGETYEIIEEQADWVKIDLGHTTGWVSAEYISVEKDEEQTVPEEETSSPPPSLTVMEIRDDKTTMRSEASTEGAILATLDKGETVQVMEEMDEWLKVSWNGNQGYIARSLVKDPEKAKQKGSNLFNKTIVIDPGHGGRDVGAIGISGSYEKNYTLMTANELKYFLEILGANVILTRSDDTYMSLGGRSSLSNLVEADVFLSLHYNSIPQYPEVTGLNTFYYSERDIKLAQTVQNELVKATNMDDNGVEFGDFQVLRINRRPSLLLELGFLSNAAEENKIQAKGFQEKIAKGIIRGLDKHFATSQ
ncbi:N-acetylmuramoyl-L-alanine amidase [Aquibacillus koreensis]|uniref:N-acetylmuramoyl-L-alanine amidase n=1 Tax=Aquibacillus koreensis TaxID=279446 RepID=A0A9X4AI84_9BACI|nr:N-acetylmuramoyl-L-alanine amidase [Aquibacillus koreensis]MCT2537664.1 N-acetylmuramoyl-L-alanine amidase [Aquibacillus koreensis]MDC3419110.1 N-acetylmuramoyl-L-alanine amidase [Aquibacillus koreensis]